MITLLAAITGFFSSILPDLIRISIDKADKKHELDILDRQIAIEQKGKAYKLEEIAISADIIESKHIYQTYRTGISWVDALNGSVRPVIAYSFFILYSVVKFMQFNLLGAEFALFHKMEILWTSEDQAIFAGIISFYYGQRALAKMRGVAK